MARLLAAALRVTIVVVVAVVIVAVVIAARTTRPQVAPGTPAAISLDSTAAVTRLSGAVRIPTVTWGDPAKESPVTFVDLRDYLTQQFPRVHYSLTREVLAGGALLYSWRGARPELPPLVFVAHQDVVPADPATLSQWKYPPFSGAIADGSVWGRGTLDCKGSVLAELEAIDGLLRAGFEPARTVYFAFDHNEEGPTGVSGATALASALKDRGVHDAILFNEGGFIDAHAPHVSQPVAFIGTAERVPVDIELLVRSTGGHASMPPAETAIGILARAIDRIEHAPMPAAIVEPTRTMIDTLAPAMSWPMRFAASNLWLTQSLIIRAMSSSPETNATIRTTIAPTQLQGSPKPNVLAAVARAVLDIRMRPGDTIDAVLDHLRRTIKDDRVEMTVVGPPHGASPVSSENGLGFVTLAQAIRAEYPNTLVTPFLTVASTNSGAFEAIAAATYRHVPVLLDGQLDEIHGVNEHIRVDTYAHAIRIYATLIHDLASAGDVRTGSR